jgi:hypothetical protein
LLYTSQINGAKYVYEVEARHYYRPGYSGYGTSSTGIDGVYIYEGDHAWKNGNKIYVNYLENFEFFNGVGSGDNLDDIIIQQRTLYGMAADSWCLVRIPDYFTPSTDSVLASSKSNLTEVA